MNMSHQSIYSLVVSPVAERPLSHLLSRIFPRIEDRGPGKLEENRSKPVYNPVPIQLREPVG